MGAEKEEGEEGGLDEEEVRERERERERERVLCVSLARCLAPSLSSHLSLARRTPSRARRAAG
jgi:hypothetical protein